MFRRIFLILIVLVVIFLLFLVLITNKNSDETAVVDRENKIPENIVKINPKDDVYPPELSIIGRKEYTEPIPLSVAINTRGAEDSPFVTPDGNSLYFFFTPDPNIPVEKQVGDGVTGIYVSEKTDGEWQKAERVILQDKNKLSLDGCEFVADNIIWFCAAREGYTGLHWFTAKKVNGKWKNWKLADFESSLEVGELHITSDGNELYYHSGRPGGKGGTDIWKIEKINGVWQNPVNIEAVNTIENEGMPFISEDGNELWFHRQHGYPEIWRSKKVDGKWQTPEMIVSKFAGEPTLDREGNLYFVHHYYKDNVMLEADIYVAYKK